MTPKPHTPFRGLDQLSLEDLDEALRSALKGLFPGRQKNDQMVKEMRVARPNFRRRLYALVQQRNVHA